jgi:ribosomal protein S18 acetylase RimI-like enzyme
MLGLMWDVEAVDAEAVRPLRREVLRPGQPAEHLVYDGDESPETLHAAVVQEGRIVGVVSIMRDGHPRTPRPGDWRIRGMASSPSRRGEGIGTALLDRCLAHAREHGGRRIWCNARVHARTLYERAGFIVEGERYEIPTIGAHYLMTRELNGDQMA